MDYIREFDIFYAAVAAFIGEEGKLMRLPLLPVVSPFTAVIGVNYIKFGSAILSIHLKNHL